MTLNEVPGRFAKLFPKGFSSGQICKWYVFKVVTIKVVYEFEASVVFIEVTSQLTYVEVCWTRNEREAFF